MVSDAEYQEVLDYVKNLRLRCDGYQGSRDYAIELLAKALGVEADKARAVEYYARLAAEKIEILQRERDDYETNLNRFCGAVNEIAKVMGHTDKQCYAPDAVVRWVEQLQEELDGERLWIKEGKKLHDGQAEKIERLQRQRDWLAKQLAEKTGRSMWNHVIEATKATEDGV